MSVNNPLPQPPLSPRPPSYRPLPPPRDSLGNGSPRPPPYVSRLSMPPPYERGEHPPLPPTPTAPPVPPRPGVTSGSPRTDDKELPSLPTVEGIEQEVGESLPATPVPMEEHMATGGQGEAPERPLPVTPDDTQISHEDNTQKLVFGIAIAYERPLPALPGGRLVPRAAYVPGWEFIQSQAYVNLEPPLPALPNIAESTDDMRPLPPLPDEAPGWVYVNERPLPSTPGEDPRTRPLPAPPDSTPDGTTSLLLVKPTRPRVAHSSSDGDARRKAQAGTDTTPLLPPLPGARERIPPPVMASNERRCIEGARRHSCGSEGAQLLREEDTRGRRRCIVKEIVGGLKRRGASGESSTERGKNIVGPENREISTGRRREEVTRKPVVSRRHSTGRRGRTPDQEVAQGVLGIQEFFGVDPRLILSPHNTYLYPPEAYEAAAAAAWPGTSEDFYPPEAYEEAAAAAWPDTSEVNQDALVNEDSIPADGPVQQPDPAGEAVCIQPRARRPLENSFECRNSCSGGVAGPHNCSRNGLSLTIQCNTKRCSRKFKNKNDFNRHFATIHTEVSETGAIKLFDCPVAGCPRVGRQGFKRRDNMLQHRRGVHGEDITKVKFRFAGE